MRNRQIILAMTIIFLCGMVAGSLVFAAYVQSIKIHNVGTIKVIGVEIYQDEALTSILNEIAWGTLDPGEIKNVNAWVKNTGSSNQKLVMWTENWNPTTAQNSIILTWDYVDSWIPADDSISVVFTLSINSNIVNVTNFSFDIWVKGVN